GLFANVLLTVTRTFTGLVFSAFRSVAAAFGVDLNPNPFVFSSYGTLPHCRMFHVSRGVSGAPGGFGFKYFGSVVEITPIAPCAITARRQRLPMSPSPITTAPFTSLL